MTKIKTPPTQQKKQNNHAVCENYLLIYKSFMQGNLKQIKNVSYKKNCVIVLCM